MLKTILRYGAMVNIISLGWNCDPAMMAVNLGLRPNKQNGYKTGPFDLMMSSYEGLLTCLTEDFARFTNVCLEGQIINKEYGFVFNHESPHQMESIGRQEGWNGPNHFIDNDYSEFKLRYNRRIDNFRSMITSPVIFMHQRHGIVSVELDEVLSSAYPGLSYRVIDICNYGLEEEEPFNIMMGNDTHQYSVLPERIGNCMIFNSSNMVDLRSLVHAAMEELQ